MKNTAKKDHNSIYLVQDNHKKKARVLDIRRARKGKRNLWLVKGEN